MGGVQAAEKHESKKRVDSQMMNIRPGGYPYLLFNQNHHFDSRGPPKMKISCGKEFYAILLGRSPKPHVLSVFVFLIVVFT